MTPICSVNCAQNVHVQRTALVVDDVEDMLDLLGIALRASDFKVIRATSTAEAVAVFESRAQEIDLLMTDICVGLESGVELARRLLALKPTLEVLAMSGFGLDGNLEAGRSRIAFLPKPFSTSELRRKLQSIFSPKSTQLTVTVSSNSAGGYNVLTAPSSPAVRPPGPRTIREGI